MGAMSIVVAWFTIVAIYQIYLYARLNGHVETKDVQWSIKEISDESYLLKAHYTFFANNKLYSGESVLLGPHFRNVYAAEKGLSENASHPWIVWFSLANPEYSSLQKNFPVKECLSSLLLWGLLIYFFGLARYVQKLKSK
jgi:hypothetical protein